jgi:hypothetical protein
MQAAGGQAFAALTSTLDAEHAAILGQVMA